MPHYQDGTEAKIGDLVVGKTYNLQGRTIVGTMLEVIPGAESCNCRVAFADVLRQPSAKLQDGRIEFRSSNNVENHALIEASFDYGETKAFKLLARHGD